MRVHRARRWMIRFGWVLVCIACWRVSGLAAEDGAALRADAIYEGRKSHPVVHEVDFSIVVTPPYECQVLKVWVPVPPSDGAQEITSTRFTTFPLTVEPQFHRESVFGNQFAYFEFHQPKGAQVIRHRFRATVWDVRWDLQPQLVRDVQNWPAEFEPFLKATRLADEQQFESVLRQVVPERRGAGTDLPLIMKWIDENLTYDHLNASLKADVDHALTQRRGHCSDYHGLCATMGRALGYPSCLTYGISLFPKNSPTHCKMDAFLPPYGWVSFDISETQKMVKEILANDQLSAEQKHELTAAARRRLFSGFRENSWLLLTRGTEYELAPKASRPVSVVRTAYVEADGEALPDPDPSNGMKREFSWMTVHHYQADKPFKMPFKDYSTLSAE